MPHSLYMALNRRVGRAVTPFYGSALPCWKEDPRGPDPLASPA